jgi:TPP-dependent pyruvate/acetoin dehydrogenase alpha subunit
MDKGWWTEEEESAFSTSTRKEVLAALTRAESRKKPSVEEVWRCASQRCEQVTARWLMIGVL